MARLLLIDASPLIYANYAAMGHFSTKAGIPTGIRYGFLRSVRSYAEKLKADRVCVVYDHPSAVLKASQVESYKADRVTTEGKLKMWSQIPDLKELVKLTRWAQAEAEGFEADDVIGHLAREFAKQGHDAFIVTPDNDMLQLISDRIHI